MIDVFFCSCPLTDERADLAERMKSLWQALPDIRLTPLSPDDGQLFGFQKERRIIADRLAKSKIYILTDDDMEPLFHFNKAVRLMNDYPTFGILSALPENAAINPWTSEHAINNQDVMEHVDVGGLRFIRKGLIPNWPEQTKPSYDREHCETMRANGYRVGYMKNLKAIHHGEGKSDLWSHSQKASVQ